MNEIIGYWQCSRKRRFSTIATDFNGSSPDAFFDDRLSILEKFALAYNGKITFYGSRRVSPFEKLGITVDFERLGSIYLPEKGEIHLYDYSKYTSIDCFPNGVEYIGRLHLILNDEKIGTEVKTLCSLIFPINNEILKWLPMPFDLKEK
ncbi:MAG TPA: hypothetical protein HA362_03915 [Nanoarchaeota archaeon]|nr:hypothetical protein [Nanoarchaeota archaeon]